MDSFITEIVGHHKQNVSKDTVLANIRTLWDVYPELRLGQLLFMVCKRGKTLFEINNFDLCNLLEKKRVEGI